MYGALVKYDSWSIWAGWAHLKSLEKGVFPKKTRATLQIITFLVFMTVSPFFCLGNITGDNHRVEFLSITPSGSLLISEPAITFNGPDSITVVYAGSNEGVIYGRKEQFGTFGLPKILSGLSGQVNYDNKYSSVVKIETSDRLGMKIEALRKPGWLTITYDLRLNIVAGSNAAGWANGTGDKARFNAPYALASDSKGSIYVADQIDNRIRKISLAGEVSTVAGTLVSGFVDGTGADARFDTPSGIAVDRQGYIYISDQQNNSIRRISTSGVVITLAGSQKAGYVDGEASAARFSSPAGICVDSKGFIYVADRGNNRIRMISPEGRVSTLAGSGQPGFSEGKGTVAKFNAPTGIAVDRAGNVFVADQVNNRIRKISPQGDVSTFAGTGEFESRDGEGAVAAFKYPSGIVADSLDNLFVTDQLSHSIRQISPSGKVTSFSFTGEIDLKTGKPGLTLNNPTGICLNNGGNIFIADYHNHNVKVIDMNALLYGTPTKDQVGTHEVILQTSNEFGTSVHSGKITVLDNIGPTVVSTFPSNLATGIPRTLNALITFDEPVVLRDSGSVTISSSSQTILKYNISQAIADKKIALSNDHKSLTISLINLPAASALRISIDNGIVMDKSNNPFEKAFSPLAPWTFTTNQKEKQAIDAKALTTQMYGDPVFKIGPVHSSAGLLIEYSAEDPTVLLIKGDSARILKAGKTQIIAFQKGDSTYLEEKIVRSITVLAKPVVVKPIMVQVTTYGHVFKPIKFEIISGSLSNDDKFAGQLEKAKGDTVGIYSITSGSLTLGSNYELKILEGTITIQKAPLFIKAENQTKLAGSANPKFAGIYEGFVNGDTMEDLLTKPEYTCTASNLSPIGKYTINLTGARAKNYSILYQPGILAVLPGGSTEFSVKQSNFFENMVTGSIAAMLNQSNPGDQTALFTLTQGDGDEDNKLFQIIGNSIISAGAFDYESRHQFFIRVKAEGAYGEFTEKKITILLTNVNEQPEMNKIPLGIVCSNGVIKLTGINSGPEKDQDVKVQVMDLGSRSYLEVSQPEDGSSELKYSVSAGFGKILNLRIVLTDNGGSENGGVDSTVYTYALNIVRHAPLHILSEKGSILPRGTSSIMSVKGSGKFQWYFNDQKILGEQGNSLIITAEQSGTISVEVINEEGCTNVAKMDINVINSPPVAPTNLISANFDGINDAFIVRNIEYYPGNELWIIDQNGKLVFNQKNYTNSWKGTHNGSTLPAGTYYYLLELGNKTAKLKGYISVVN